MFCAWFFSLWWMEKNSLAVSTSKKVPLKVARPCAFHFFMFTAGLWLWHSKIDSQGAKKREREREKAWGIGWGAIGKELFTSCVDDNLSL